MREYKYIPNNNQGKIFLIAAPLMASAIGAFVFVKNGDQSIDYIKEHPTFVAVYLLIVSMGLFALWKNIVKNQNRAVIITLDGNKISGKIDNVFSRTIEKNEVAKILETENGTLIVCKANNESIGIPYSIEGYEEIRNTLQSWTVFTPTKNFKQTFSFYKFFPGIVFIASLVAATAIQNPQIAIIFTALGVAAGIHIFFLLGKLNTSMPQIARLRWFVLFVTTMFLFSKLVSLLVAQANS